MPSQGNIEIFRQVVDLGFNSGKLEELDKLVAGDLVEHQFGGESGLVALKELVSVLRAAFPDLKMTIEDATSSGEKVWVRLRCRGTHRGQFMGLAPTGRTIDTMAIEIGRFSDGKLVEHWGVPDRFAAMAQLGLLRAPREAPFTPPA
jgi:predicted ester cyclase